MFDPQDSWERRTNKKMLIDMEAVTKGWKEQGNIHKFGIQISPH
jgi:ribosomal protein L3